MKYLKIAGWICLVLFIVAAANTVMVSNEKDVFETDMKTTTAKKFANPDNIITARKAKEWWYNHSELLESDSNIQYEYVKTITNMVLIDGELMFDNGVLNTIKFKNSDNDYNDVTKNASKSLYQTLIHAGMAAERANMWADKMFPYIQKTLDSTKKIHSQ